LMLFTNR